MCGCSDVEMWYFGGLWLKSGDYRSELRCHAVLRFDLLQFSYVMMMMMMMMMMMSMFPPTTWFHHEYRSIVRVGLSSSEYFILIQ
jgi:hypothetical protein